MALIVLVLLVSAAILVLSSFHEGLVDDTSASTIINETVTALSNTTGSNLANNYVVSVTQVSVYNATANVTLTETTDYTVDRLGEARPATITLVNDGYALNTSYVTYTYKDDRGTVAMNASVSGLEGTTNASTYFSIIGTFIGITALLVVVIGLYGFFSR